MSGFNPHAVDRIFINRNLEQLRKHLAQLSCVDLPKELRQELNNARRCFYQARKDTRKMLVTIRELTDELEELEAKQSATSIIQTVPTTEPAEGITRSLD